MTRELKGSACDLCEYETQAMPYIPRAVEGALLYICKLHSATLVVNSTLNRGHESPVRQMIGPDSLWSMV